MRKDPTIRSQGRLGVWGGGSHWFPIKGNWHAAFRGESVDGPGG